MFQSRPTTSRNRPANRARSVGADAGVVAAGAVVEVPPRAQVKPRKPPKATPFQLHNPSLKSRVIFRLLLHPRAPLVAIALQLRLSFLANRSLSTAPARLPM